MTAPFRRLTPDQFKLEVRGFNWTRRIWRVDMHHTWYPAHADYSGLDTIERMAAYHETERGFDDIAQHVSIAPDGTIWTGRDWNTDPASVGGSSSFGLNAGAFMIDAIGNFDWGFDRLEGRQLDSVITVINAVQQRFRLPVQALLFHRELPLTVKTSPGTSVDKGEMVRMLATHRRDGRPVDHVHTSLVA